jgi:8-oxo-dGTP pyrophosphatase MutT (NUDIX family)
MCGDPDWFTQYASALEDRLQDVLPGIDAQREMAPAGRFPPDYDPAPPDARYGAVLLLLFPREVRMVAPFIRRPSDDTPHGGQIALPGGGLEGHERFPTDTALREAREEIGVAPGSLRVLGALTPLYIWVSNYSVVPVVAVTPYEPVFTADPGEVEEVLLLGVDDLDAGRDEQSFATPRGRVSAPCFHTGGVSVWGATAMILSEFLQLHRELRALTS